MKKECQKGNNIAVPIMSGIFNNRTNTDSVQIVIVLYINIAVIDIPGNCQYFSHCIIVPISLFGLEYVIWLYLLQYDKKGEVNVL